MSDILFYSESIEDATLTVNSLGSNASYPSANLLDRNHHVYWKALNANTSGYIDIDLGSARACDYLILGEHNYSNVSYGIKLASDDNDNGAYSAVTYVIGSAGAYHAYEANNYKKWYEVFASTSKRYWRLSLEAMGGGTYQQIATIFMGTRWEHAHNPELGIGNNSEYIVNIGKTTAGITRSQINNTTKKRSWDFDYSYIISSEKTKFETWRDNIYMSNDLSHYPFYFIDITNKLYYARAVGILNLQEQAYDVWQTKIALEEEL